ncbi:hypothetical protein [Vibrio nomapromontoriensis]|uniref:hypothetical protein n=1 Tax=Vibrio nomapromontoriensis TaxID=2910246 RepID=UPI003D0FE1BD
MIKTLLLIAGIKPVETAKFVAVERYINTSILCVGEDLSLQDVRVFARSASDFHAVAAISKSGAYLGLLPLIHLLTADPKRLVSEFILARNHYIFSSANAYQASQQLTHSQWNILPVLNSEHRVIGAFEHSKARALNDGSKTQNASIKHLQQFSTCA